MSKVIIKELKGLPHTLACSDGSAFRIFSWQEKRLDERMLSQDFTSEQKAGGIGIYPVPEVKNEEIKMKSHNKEEKNNG